MGFIDGMRPLLFGVFGWVSDEVMSEEHPFLIPSLDGRRDLVVGTVRDLSDEVEAGRS